MTVDIPSADNSTSQVRFGRYLTVTSVAAPANLVLYGVLLELTSVSEAAANALAAVVVISARIGVSDVWVWRGQGRQSASRRIFAQMSLSFIGLCLTTLAAWLLGRANASTLLLLLANLAVLVGIWLGRFLVLERMVYRSAPRESIK